MGKKKNKQYFIMELDDESDEDKVLTKHFIAKSKDGLIVGESKAKGDHYTFTKLKLNLMELKNIHLEEAF